LIELLRWRAHHQPQKRVYTYLLDGETEEQSLTYEQLDQRARTIAAKLQTLGAFGERVLLLYPPGLEFIGAFIGCLYAGAVAVPINPPQHKRTFQRAQSILLDAQASIILTNAAFKKRLEKFAVQTPGLETMRWVITDEVESCQRDEWQPPQMSADSLALLQYTSGSTGTPKGVMLTHGNLLHNQRVIEKAFEHSEETIVAGWLPFYHDMGLIGNLLQPLYAGFPCVLLSPLHFLQRPYRWLQAISKYRATTSGAPNFAYDYCARRITAEERQTLDLSSWAVAFNGAEPVRPDTIDRFVKTFEPCGFRRESMYPCYGLAEATLMVTGGRKTAPPILKRVDGAALERNRVVETSEERKNARLLVGCGQPLLDEEILIVDPETLTRCPTGTVGEVWVSSPSVAQGYWNRPEESARTFQARLSETLEGPFLRTGDVGFLSDRELFVTGRIKDLIILRGANYYPQDIERTVEDCHPALRSGANAAFSIDVSDEERLVVVQEVEYRQQPDTTELIRTIRRAVIEAHEIPIYAIALIKAGTIHKTSSGKIQRQACRRSFLDGTLEVLAQWTEDDESTSAGLVATGTPTVEMLIELWREVLGIERIGSEDNFFALGGHSLLATQLVSRIRDVFQIELPLYSLFETPTIIGLAETIETLQGERPSADSPIIPPATRGDEIPLSSAQQRLWIIDQLAPGNPAYNLFNALRITGDLNVAALRESLQQVVLRHEALRTTFTLAGHQPLQIIHPSLHLHLPLLDLSALPASDRSHQARLLAQTEARTGFDLRQGPLLRARLLRLEEQEHWLLLTMHHIVSDGWSMGVLLREIRELYGAGVRGEESRLAELPIQYADYAVWQREWLSRSGGADEQLNYWCEQLAGSSGVLTLPSDRPRPSMQTFRGATKSFHLPLELAESLRELSRLEGTTLFMTLLAAFKVLLYRHSGQRDILTAIGIANRTRTETEGLIGCFVNTLPVRARFTGEPSFRELLSQVRESALGAYAHQDLPFDRLIDALKIERDPSRNPLVQVGFVLQNVALPDFELGELKLERLEIENGTSKLDLTLSMTETESGIAGSFEYSTDLFDESSILRLAARLRTLLESIVVSPEAKVSSLPILPASERQKLLGEWNQATIEYPRDKFIHQLFEEVVEENPDKVALVFGDRQLSYGQLNAKANQLAHHLRKRGVGPDVLVGLYAERSLEMFIGVLGILKAGGAYVPLDPLYPKERLAFMLEDAKASILVTQERLAGELGQSGQSLCLDRDWPLIEQESTDNPEPWGSPDNLAYVIYTSGSTGRPKGVMIAHRSLVSAALAWERAYRLRSVGTCHLQMASISFDVFAEDLIRSLCSGAKLVICPREVALDPARLYELMLAQKIDCAEFVPASLRILVQYLQEAGRSLDFMRLIIVGSDSWFVREFEQFKKLCGAETRLINSYGMSEATIDGSYFEGPVEGLAGERLVPAGRPFDNTQFYLLDSHAQPVPIGVPGELCVAGLCLARGYNNQPGRTAERFIPNPFSDEPGARLYKSGDQARYLPDGNIEFLGRVDNRVKIRGTLIELGEVEAVLRQYPAVKAAAVVLAGDETEEQHLVAYVVADYAALEEVDDSRSPSARQSEQVGRWLTVFDELYKETPHVSEPTFYVKGWNSSYTGLPMPDDEVREWVDQTAERILSLRPKRVLDIGCGSGLMLFRIAPHCSAYCATDLSQEPLRYVRQQLESLEQDMPPVTLLQRPADDFRDFAENSFDAVIIVSVAQYFPSLDYLTRVIESAVHVVEPGGFIFLGDLRSLPLLEAFHASVQLEKAPASLPSAQLRQRISEQVLYEKQLVVDPAYFLALQERVPKISGLSIQLLRGPHHNELTKFRNDVVLYVGGHPPTMGEAEWLDWGAEGLTISSLCSFISERQPETLGVARVPNSRVLREFRLLESLANSNGHASNARELREVYREMDGIGVDPAEFWKLGEEWGYHVNISWTDFGRDAARYDVIFKRRRENSPTELFFSQQAKAAASELDERYATNPVQAAFVRELLPRLQNYLSTKLPSYMVPSLIVPLDALPLSPNGKIDRRALPPPDFSKHEQSNQYTAPRNATEEILTAIWAEVLGVSRIGVHDNWFEFGGNSLLATQFVSRVRERLMVNLTLRSLFENPTVAQLAIEVERLILDEIEQLPEEQV
jgi:amino acid adenylation domain-containing protein